MDGTIIKAKIWGRYRKCELLGIQGNAIDVRILGSDMTAQGLGSLHTVFLSSVAKVDQQKCLELDPHVGSRHRITMKKNVMYQQHGVILKQGVSFHTKSLQYRGQYAVVPSNRFGELLLPIDAIKVEALAQETEEGERKQ